MSQHLGDLKVGESMLMRGPRGELDYTGPGRFTITHGYGDKATSRKIEGIKKLGMVCGGTGLTPMLQVLQAILRDPSDKTEVWMIFANQTVDDILLRDLLESFPPSRFHLYCTLDRPPPKGWKGGVGFVTEQMCREHLPPPALDAFVFNCGPPPMIKFAVEPNLEKIGFKKEQCFNF